MGWHPKHPVILHNHLSIPAGMDFFWPAPEEIGELLSAHSTLHKGDRWLGVRKKWWIVPGMGLLGFALAAGVGLSQWEVFGVLPSVLTGVYLAFLTMGVTFFFIPWTDSCTYVGEKGLAKGVRIQGLGIMLRCQSFLFADGAALVKTWEDVDQLGDDGGYSHTKVSYRWKNAGGRCAFQISAKFDRRRKNAEDVEAIQFAYSAQEAWFAYRVRELRRQIKDRGTAIFNVTTDDWFEVGRESIKVVSGGVTQMIKVIEMEKIVVHNGVFKFECPMEKYSFEFMEPSDAKLCIAALEQLCGIKFEREGESRGLF